MTASANNVTVPGDTRLNDLKISRKAPFWTKIPIIKEASRSGRLAERHADYRPVAHGVLPARGLVRARNCPVRLCAAQRCQWSFIPSQAAPSSEHIWGTTAGGYDVFSRVIWGSRTAVIAIVIAVLLSIFAGVLLGLVSGYFGGWVDRVLVMIADAIYSFPSLLLAILMAIMISGGQSGLWSGILASGISITVVYIPQYFRTIRSEVIRIKGIRLR